MYFLQIRNPDKIKKQETAEFPYLEKNLSTMFPSLTFERKWKAKIEQQSIPLIVLAVWSFRIELFLYVCACATRSFTFVAVTVTESELLASIACWAENEAQLRCNNWRRTDSSKR